MSDSGTPKISANPKNIELTRSKFEDLVDGKKNQNATKPVNDEGAFPGAKKPGPTDFKIRSGGSLKTLRVTTPAQDEQAPKSEQGVPAIRATKAGSGTDAKFSYLEEAEAEPVLMLSPANAKPMKRSLKYKVVNVGAVLLSAAWLGLCAGYIQNSVGWDSIFSLQPHLVGGFLAGALAPLALLWMVLAYTQRGADIQLYADALRAELQAMIFPSEERAQVIHKDIEELCAQAAELSTASKAVLKSLHRARAGLKHEIAELNGMSAQTEAQIDKMAEAMALRSSKLLNLTSEIEERTSEIEKRTQGGAGEWDEAAEKAGC